MRHGKSAAAFAFCLAGLAAIGTGCGSERDVGGPPAVVLATRPGPRYVCDYQMDLHGTPDCQLESSLPPGPAPYGTMRMLEVTRYLGMEPTPQQRRAADDLVRRCYASAKAHGWYDFAKATADGFTLKRSDQTHYNNEAYLFDDHVLDPDRPEYLMYYDTPEGKALVGFMFVPRTNTEEGPQIGGPLTRWHYHLWWGPICLKKGVLDLGPPVDGKCPEGKPSYRSPEMMHVWLVHHPDGPFATGMGLGPELLKRLLAERKREQGL